MRKEELLLTDYDYIRTKSRKRKICISILVSLLLASSILLAGHLKYEWFKSDEYKIDANINRSVFQANYFTEKKSAFIQFNFEDGHSEKKGYVIDNNFVVFLTEKKDNLNTAILVLLKSSATVDDKIQELVHLDMFNEEQIKELEADPNGAKYPFAVFKFTDDGKIQEIKLPNNMDEYNAEAIIELIKKIIPKLSGSKKEDMSKGLDINSKKVNNKQIITQTEAPKQLGNFKGSRTNRIVKTEIENGQVTNVESNDNLYMESKPEGDEIIYGPKDFSYDIKSDIVSNEIKYNEKENVELITKLTSKFTLITSEELLQKFAKNKEEAEKTEVEEIVEEEEPKPLRNLFSISASKPFTLASFNVLGTQVTVKYVVGVSGNSAYNKIVITCGGANFEFGNKGCSASYSKTIKHNQPLFIFYCPFPFSFVSIRAYAEGSVYAGFGLKSGSGRSAQYWAKISGSLDLGVKAMAGFDKVLNLAAFAQGTVISATGQVTISNGRVSKDSGFRLSVGRLVVGITGTAFGLTGTLWSKTLFEGWAL